MKPYFENQIISLYWKRRTLRSLLLFEQRRKIVVLTRDQRLREPFILVCARVVATTIIFSPRRCRLCQHKSPLDRSAPMASPETSSSLKFLFFMFAFTIAVPLTMLLLASLRPLLPMESAWARALVLLPLVNGIWAVCERIWGCA